MSPEFVERFHELERGQLTYEDFKHLYAYFYNQRNSTKIDSLPIMDWVEHSIDERWPSALKALRLQGIKTYLLTNNWYTDRARLLPTVPINRSLFDGVIESCKLGVRKPEAGVYKKANDIIKLRPDQILFVDDLGGNLKAAKKFGWQTYQVSNITSFL